MALARVLARRGRLAAAGVVGAVALLGAMTLSVVPVAAHPSAGTAAANQSITVDGASSGRTFDGVGALSAGASSRLLIDYPPTQRAQILDDMFTPGYGANLQILKVEIGGDTNSTDGSEPSHMRSATQVDCNQGYEWWLMEQAKARNPNIKLYGLEWGAPGWVGAGARTLYTSQNITYLLNWLDCARQHGLTIDYLGGWNEASTYPPSWYVDLRQALDANGYGAIQLVAADSYNWTTVASDMQSDPAFNQAAAIIGEHYPCGPTNCSSPRSVQATGKPIWASEQGSQPYDAGAAGLAQDLNREYVDGQMTGTINWSLLWSVYAGLPYQGDGLMLANTPWSGNYTVGKSIWVMAHTAQFTQPGWRYLDSGSVRLSGGGSVASLRAPSSDQWSSIAETVGATAAQQVTYQLRNGLSTGTVHVWATNLDSNDPSQWFNHTTDIQPQGGSFTLTLQPGYLYSLTTTTGQGHGGAAPPPAASWSLPYHENFDAYPAGSTPKYFSDIGGSFQTAPCIAGQPAPGQPAGQPAPGPGSTGQAMCLQQNATTQPVTWWGNYNYPATVVGDPLGWTNYQVTADALLPRSGSVELDGRELGSVPSGNTNYGLTGYHFRIADSGQWSLYREDPSGADTTLARGTAPFGINAWHQLGLRMRGDEISPMLDGHVLATSLDSTYPVGQVGLQASPWVPAQFDNVTVTPQPVHGHGPQLGAVTPDPVQIAAPGDSATVSTTVTNPGPGPASGVSAQMQVPSGWTATALTAPPNSLAAGQSAPLSWRITAPASAAPDSYQGQITATYQEGGVQWIATAQVPIDLAIVPQSQMKATATSAQAGYPPSNAIDGNPATIWHTQYSPVRDYPPQSITLDLGGTHNLTGLLYLPRQDNNINGIITSYKILVSQDGTTFTQVASGNWALDSTQKSASFTASGVRDVQLVGVQGGSYDGQGYVSAAEINVEGS